jgi:hypothetical protein
MTGFGFPSAEQRNLIDPPDSTVTSSVPDGLVLSIRGDRITNKWII